MITSLLFSTALISAPTPAIAYLSPVSTSARPYVWWLARVVVRLLARNVATRTTTRALTRSMFRTAATKRTSVAKRAGTAVARSDFPRKTARGNGGKTLSRTNAGRTTPPRVIQLSRPPREGQSPSPRESQLSQETPPPIGRPFPRNQLASFNSSSSSWHRSALVPTRAPRSAAPLLRLTMEDAKDYLSEQGFEIIAEGVGFRATDEFQMLCNFVLRYRDNLYCTKLSQGSGSRLPAHLNNAMKFGSFLEDVVAVAEREPQRVWVKEVCFEGRTRVACSSAPTSPPTP